MDELPRVALPDDFIKMRDAARARNTSATPTVPTENFEELTIDSDTVDGVAGSENPQDGSTCSTADSTARSDGLLIDESTIEQILDSVVTSVQKSLSSELVDNSSQAVIDQKSSDRNKYFEKRDSEIAGLRAAISNAVEKGSCPAEKLSIVDKAASLPRPEPESPPDAPRNPRDRRKRLRSGSFRYVSRDDTPNTLQSLVSELKLVFQEPSIGMNLSDIFAALEDHVDRPLEDTWSGVSPK